MLQFIKDLPGFITWIVVEPFKALFTFSADICSKDSWKFSA